MSKIKVASENSKYIASLRVFGKRLHVSRRTKEIVLYGGLIALAAILIIHGLIQEVSDYHPRVQGAATKAPLPVIASKTATASSKLKQISLTVIPTPKHQAVFTPTSTLSTTPTVIPSRAIIQSAVEEKNPKRQESVPTPMPTPEQCFLSLAENGSCPLGITIGKLHL